MNISTSSETVCHMRKIIYPQSPSLLLYVIHIMTCTQNISKIWNHSDKTLRLSQTRTPCDSSKALTLYSIFFYNKAIREWSVTKSVSWKTQNILSRVLMDSRKNYSYSTWDDRITFLWPWYRTWPYRITRGCHGAFAMNITCEKGSSTPQYTCFRLFGRGVWML